jgi:hypothetical protein
LRSALAGAYALFLVTSFWEKMDATLEEQQGKNVADVAKVRSKRFHSTSLYVSISLFLEIINPRYRN